MLPTAHCSPGHSVRFVTIALSNDPHSFGSIGHREDPVGLGREQLLEQLPNGRLVSDNENRTLVRTPFEYFAHLTRKR